MLSPRERVVRPGARGLGEQVRCAKVERSRERANAIKRVSV
jgi:hypothetical protein